MRHFYIDTNVFISRWKPDDPNYSEAKIIASSLQKGEISACTSVLTLLETASVAGRLYAHRMKDRGPEKKKMFIIKTIRRLAALRIRFIHLAGDIPLVLGNIKVDMPTLLADSIFLSFLTALRTLDLMHIAAARHAKQIDSEKLGAFVTGDAELLARKDEISKIIEMPVLSPKEYVQALGLVR
jgi:predicted nucleic acid-binding protein